MLEQSVKKAIELSNYVETLEKRIKELELKVKVLGGSDDKKD